MIKINPGPTLKRFVLTYLRELDYDEDEAMDDLIASANAYVHGPWPEALKPFLEASEAERWESYKRYIKNRLDASTAGRIKAQLAEERRAA